MSRRWAGACLAVLGGTLLLGPPTVAQEGPAKKTIPATPILPAGKPVDAAQEAPQGDEVDAVIGEFDAAVQAWSTKMRAASAEERQALMSKRPNAEEFAGKLRDIAAANPKTDKAAKALTWVAANLRDSDAIDTLLRDHMESESVGDLCLVLVGMEGEEAQANLEMLAEKSPHESVRGRATYFLGYKLQRAKKDQEALPYFRKVVENFKELSDPRLGDLVARAKGAINEVEHLQIGMVAVDIEGVDMDGVAFKLSDYRGKVVLLDFWGHW